MDCCVVLSGATSWDILLVTVLTAVVAVVQHHVVAELVEALTCAATTAMRWDTSHATVQQRRSRRQ